MTNDATRAPSGLPESVFLTVITLKEGKCQTLNFSAPAHGA